MNENIAKIRIKRKKFVIQFVVETAVDILLYLFVTCIDSRC